MTTIDRDIVVDRVHPLARKAIEILVSATKLCAAGALMIFGAVFGIAAAMQLRLTDAALLQQAHGSPPTSATDERTVLLLLVGAGVVVMIWGLHRLHDWFRPHQQQAQRVAQLERELHHEVEQLENELHEATQFAEEAAGALDALAAVETVLKIPGVCEAARKAARKVLHPDGHPGASDREIRDLTERFQMAEAVFDRFGNQA
jgi:hypothetical protein